MRFILPAIVVFSSLALAQTQSAPKDNPAPPRSDRAEVESSSKDNRVDLSPPAGDAKAHPDGGDVAEDVLELRPYDPHKAMKNVEVGDYYFRQKNYRAAASRYQEALAYKPNDAIATFKLATALEKTGELAEARKAYEGYLKILPEGPNSEEAKKAMQRLPKPAPEEKPAFGELKPTL